MSKCNSADLATVKKNLSERASALGFHLFGVAPVPPAEKWQALPEIQFFSSWLQDGHAAQMDYLKEREAERRKIHDYFPGVRSALACGMYYAPKDAVKKRGAEKKSHQDLQISRYARGKDYHPLLKKRLQKLAQALEQQVSCKTRVCVDTAPVLERALAFRAGLGWFGKNSCIINRQQGSYFFIGIILTDLLLPADGMAAEHCGSCTLCLDACPTGALRAPMELDANRCISYWNIEHRGAIPEEIKNKMGGLLFGCDICQEVCPWNQESLHLSESPVRAPIVLDAAFAQPQNMDDLLTKILDSNDTNFTEAFAGRPLKRARWQGLMRNAAIVMGNLKKREFSPKLREIVAALPESDALKTEIHWALDRLSASSKSGD